MTYHTDIDIRYGDQDPMGHVNNAAYHTYMEEGRAEYYADIVDVDFTSLPTVIAEAAITHHAPIDGRGCVTVAVTVPELGTSSIPMEYELTYQDTVVATGSTVQVYMDPAEDTPTAVPETYRERIRAFEDL